MTPSERHALVIALFHEALEQPAEERTAWLMQASDDEATRKSVAGLLEAHQRPASFIDHPVLGRAAPDGQSPIEVAERTSGLRVGPWQIEDRIGEGGMGVVYRASRADGLYNRTVALKLLAPGGMLATGDRLARRLTAERQIHARLEHDGIARLYDGGVTEDGLPYLALELVMGEPITAYAANRSLSVDQRIQLFARACDAVAYAHRSLVVHRDIKPAHILVVEGNADDEPTVKLLDFGIAELLDAANDADRSAVTVLGALTPAYAAPEQLRGQPVTTLADVYALGVVLYELLADRRPYDLSGKTAAEVERLVTYVEPPLPSALAPPSSARRLRGDLETIVMKALAKEPERRYASADALADDLRRNMAGLPIKARKATAGYRMSRFAGRNRLGVGATTTFILLAVALISFYTLRLKAERDRAESASAEAREEADRAEAVARFLEQILRAPNTNWYVENEAKGPETPIREVLDEAAVRVDAEFANRPDIRADIHHILGDTYSALGLHEEGDRHHLRVLAIRESLYAPPHPKLAEALFYAAGRGPSPDMAEYVHMLERAAAMQRAWPEGNNFPFILEALAVHYQYAGRFAESDSLLDEAVNFVRARFVSGHDGHRYRDRLLIILPQYQAISRMNLDDLAGASDALAISDSVMARLPQTANYHDAWRAQSCHRGRLRRLQRRADEAEAMLIACLGERARHVPIFSGAPLASPFSATEALPAHRHQRLREEASANLVALYEALGRSDAAAPFRANAARFHIREDSLRRAYSVLAAPR